MKRIAQVILTAMLTLAAVMPTAQAAPRPISFCMPDLDGHCRYCEIRFSPISTRCTG